MARRRRDLTELGIRQLAAPREGRREVADGHTPGLVLRVTERGVKTFSVIYKVPGEGGLSRTGRALRGRQHRVTLGEWPAKSLADARAEAREIREAALGGADPRPARRAAVALKIENSVEAVSKRMIKLASVQDTTRMEQTLEDHVWPTLGARPISAVSRSDVHELLDGLVERGRLGTAREVRKHLSRLFNFAVDRSVIAGSPMIGMQRDDLARDPRERSLTDEELRAVWLGAAALGYPFGPVVQLLALTGQRRSEWAEARASQIDKTATTLTIPAARYKSRHDHVVPLSEPAWKIVSDLPARKGDYCLFAARGSAGRSPISGWSDMKERLDAAALAVLRKGDPRAELAHWTVHDLRRTCTTGMARLGVAEEVRAAVRGQAKRGLDGTYNKYDYLEEKRAALAKYAEHVMGIVA